MTQRQLASCVNRYVAAKFPGCMVNDYEIALPVRNEYYLPVLLCSPSAYEKGCIDTSVCMYALYAGPASQFGPSESARVSVGYYTPATVKAFGEFLTKRLRACSEYADKYGSTKALARAGPSLHFGNPPLMKAVGGARILVGNLAGAKEILRKIPPAMEKVRQYWNETDQPFLDKVLWLLDAIDRAPKSIPAKLRRWRNETAKEMGYEALLKASLQSTHSCRTV